LIIAFDGARTAVLAEVVHRLGTALQTSLLEANCAYLGHEMGLGAQIVVRQTPS